MIGGTDRQPDQLSGVPDKTATYATTKEGIWSLPTVADDGGVKGVRLPLIVL